MQVIISCTLLLHLVSWLALVICEEGTGFSGNIPHYIQPISYSIGLKVSLSDWRYSGRTQVLINITEPCSQIPINSENLNITDVFLATFTDYQYGSRVPINEVIEDKSDFKFLRIYPKYTIPAGLYVLYIEFEKHIINELWGFYRSKWTDSQGWVNKMAATHFSPDKARKAWPCFDEPRLKARFKFFVEHESVYEAVSNGALESRQVIRPGWVRSIFERTPPMSTYITAVVISNYKYIESQTQSGVITRVYGNPAELDHSKEELSIITKCVDYLEDYTKIDYAMNKLYLMPVPDIGVGAMENWGLITARTDVANYHKDKMGAAYELIRRITLTHEVTHMWFGNLVTNKWWDSIMMKEGITSWLMYVVADGIYSDFDHANEYAILESLLDAMKNDELSSTRPIIKNARTSREILSLFDYVAYHKGGMVFRMVQNIIGPDLFQEALQSYLYKNKFSTGTVADVIKAFADVTPPELGYDMVGFMERYTTQKHYPLVHVRLLNKTHVLVTQEVYLPDQDITHSPYYNYTWYIPFTYTTDTHRNDKVIMLKEKVNIVKLAKPSSWIKANNDFKMYYRTNYDLVNWRQIYQQLMTNHTYFTVPDRMQLIDDFMNLAAAGKMEVSLCIQILTYLTRDRAYGPWKLASGHLDMACARMTLTEKEACKVFKRALVDELLKEAVEWSPSYNKPIKERMMQYTIIDFAMKAEHPLAEEYIDNLTRNDRFTHPPVDINWGTTKPLPDYLSTPHITLPGEAIDFVTKSHSQKQFSGIVEFATPLELEPSSAAPDEENTVEDVKKRSILLEKNPVDDTEDPDIKFLAQLWRAKTNPGYWDELLATLPEVHSQDRPLRIQILCSTTNRAALWKLLEESIKEDIMPKEGRSDVIIGVANVDHSLAWKFFSLNYDAYYDTFGNTQFIMDTIITEVTGKLTSMKEYKVVKKFFEEHDPGSGGTGVERGLEMIMANVHWKQHYRKKYRDFFYTFARQQHRKHSST